MAEFDGSNVDCNGGESNQYNVNAGNPDGKNSKDAWPASYRGTGPGPSDPRGGPQTGG